MMLSGENRRTRRQTCPNAVLAAKKLILTDLLSITEIQADSLANNRLSHGAPKELTSIRPYEFKV